MKSYSAEGDHNLEVIHKATKFTDWMYAQIKPHLHGRVLEIGSGIGTYSEKVVQDFDEVILSDLDATYVKKLAKKFGRKGVTAKKIDLMEPKDYPKTRVDSVFALNVLEHIKDDVAVLERLYGILPPGGRVVLLVPAHQWLYNCIDEAVGHYRRYTRKNMLATVGQTNFKVKKLFYFNVFAIPGWILNGHILKKTELGSGLMNLFNNLVPVFAFIERFILFKRLGISLIIVLEKE